MNLNAILGMDWPSQNHAMGDCHGKKVTFRISEKKEFNFQSLPRKQEKNTLPVISAAKGWKSLK